MFMVSIRKRRCEHLPPLLPGIAPELLDHMRALEKQMRVGLGREADGAMHLYVLRRILQGSIHGHQPRGNAVKLLSRALLGLNDRREEHLAQRGFRADGHVGTDMFDRLERADWLTELLPALRVFNGHITGGL